MSVIDDQTLQRYDAIRFREREREIRDLRTLVCAIAATYPGLCVSAAAIDAVTPGTKPRVLYSEALREWTLQPALPPGGDRHER